MLRGRAAKIAGISLIVLSGVCWLALPGVPFLAVSAGWKGAIATALFVIAEIFFWVGCWFAGKDFVKKLRWGRIRDWFRRLAGLPQRSNEN